MMLLPTLSLALHLGFLWLFWIRVKHHKDLTVSSSHWLFILAITLVNLSLMLQSSLDHGQVNINLDNLLLFSIAFCWLLAVLITATTANAALLILTCFFNTLLLITAITLPEKATASLAPNQTVHVLLSISAYGLVSITAIYSLLLLLNEYLLHEIKKYSIAKLLPSLIETEHCIVLLSITSWINLSLVLISGFFILEDLFAQKVAHKTLLTLLSWLLFSILLFLRFSKGLRGKHFCLLIISAFTFLMVGFMGSKFIIDYLIG